MNRIAHIFVAAAVAVTAHAGDRPSLRMVDRHEHERGPDTEYARNGFESRFGFAPPASVTNVYYYNPPGWLDGIWRVQFKVSDTNVVARIAQHLDLKAATEPEIGIISSTKKPIPVSWRQPIQGSRIIEWRKQAAQFRAWIRKKKDYFWYLWFDEKTSTVWYEEFST